MKLLRILNYHIESTISEISIQVFDSIIESRSPRVSSKSKTSYEDHSRSRGHSRSRDGRSRSRESKGEKKKIVINWLKDNEKISNQNKQEKVLKQQGEFKNQHLGIGLFYVYKIVNFRFSSILALNIEV